ncbi:hypothetical protein SAMN05444350_1575 [Bacteroides stercorirosoris]|uniref:Uncharacterized protein n=1 Tax=Bacteroides stercorirosoris TaxID=871324 RepID=A0A1M6LX95_9BACE|nr:hypothetical protein SAMN05444350_1575 [Bacteroides stercorirosoris]
MHTNQVLKICFKYETKHSSRHTKLAIDIFYLFIVNNKQHYPLIIIPNGAVMSFRHRVTQSLTEFYSFDFKLIKLCDTLCYSVVN